MKQQMKNIGRKDIGHSRNVILSGTKQLRTKVEQRRAGDEGLEVQDTCDDKRAPSAR